MQNRTQSASGTSQFAKVAAEELVSMQLFVALLEQERSMLAAGKADALPAIAAEKTHLVNLLSQAAEQRAHLLDSSGTAGDGAGIGEILGKDADTREIWEKLMSVARRAAELNAGNGYLVNQRLSQINRAIHAIGGPRAPLYGTTGFTSFGASPSRSLAQG